MLEGSSIDSMLSIIAAIGDNRELGSENKLLWNIPGELKRFKEITLGHPIIMGRKTWESLPEKHRPLPGRTNIIITRDDSFQLECAAAARSPEQAITSARTVILNGEKKTCPNDAKFLGPVQDDNQKDEIFFIGGGQIFAQVLPMVNRLYLTVVHKTFSEADVFFPEYSEFTKVIERQKMKCPDFSYEFLTLERR